MNIDIERACAGLRALGKAGERIPHAFIDISGEDAPLSISGIPVYAGAIGTLPEVDLGIGCRMRFIPVFMVPAPQGSWWRIYKDAYEDYMEQKCPNIEKYNQDRPGHERDR